ncbi:venom allergen 3-like isoform X2 [Linepithema humile]|uniref:venom allergen 3-like isoform X2 n=1 Tax=Linepithema humile TaxID=83485 RepID=UPI00351E16A3
MAKMFLLYLAIIIGAFSDTTATNYCNITLCQNAHNLQTMCMYRSSTPGPKCVQWSNQGLTDAERSAIVLKHNQLRQNVALGKERRGRNGPQPAAVHMPNLSWDNELETIAQRWANQCIMGHDSCRNVERFNVGQNIAWISSTDENKSTLEQIIQFWYNEVDKFDKNLISAYRDKDGDVISHYTQLVWANTTKVGCGRIKFKHGDWNKHYLVCNYGPTGNVRGGRIYEIKK